MNADVIRFRITAETNGFDVGVPKQQRLADAIYSVHHAAVGHQTSSGMAGGDSA